MGLFTYELKCGCVEVTSTLEKEPKTFTLSYCKEHTPAEMNSPPKKGTEKKPIKQDPTLNSNGDTS